MDNFIGKVYDGRWEVVAKRNGNRGHTIQYSLRNIFNERIIRIDGRTLKKVDNGETTISKVMAHNIKCNNFCR
jgi:hypothetical protein